MKIALITAPLDEAKGLAHRAVGESVAACVNILYGITSIYRWQDEVHTDGEAMLIAKVPDDKVDEFVAKIRGWHPYQCPEIILLDPVGGNPDYFAWADSGGRVSPRKA